MNIPKPETDKSVNSGVIEKTILCSINPIPQEVYAFFDDIKPVGHDVYHLVEITKWAKENSNSMVDTIQKIKKLENKLGVSNDHEHKITRMYNWVKMTRRMQDAKEIRNAMERN